MPLYFSQTDINQYLDTKAAAYTMVDCILETAGVTEAEISRLYLTGAFPAHSDLESAITIGIFPDLPREKYTLLKNNSLAGAGCLLLNRHRLAEVKELAESIYCVQFASFPDFLVRMQQSSSPTQIWGVSPPSIRHTESTQSNTPGIFHTDNPGCVHLMRIFISI